MAEEFKNEAGWPVCPLSLDHANLLSDFKLHHCRAGELAAHGGVCAKCAAQIKKRGASLLNGKTEVPVELTVHHTALTLLEDHAGLTSTGEVVPTVDFDFAAIDGLESFETENVRHETVLAFGLILSWVWERGFEVAMRRFTVLSMGLKPDLVNNESYEQVAKRFNTSKQTLNKAATNFQRKFRIRFSRGRTEEARRRMAAAQSGHRSWSTKKRNQPVIKPL